MSKLFQLSKNNRFGLEYPSLEERQGKLFEVCLERIYDLDQSSDLSKLNFSSHELNNLLIFNKKPKIRDSVQAVREVAKNTELLLNAYREYKKSDIVLLLDEYANFYRYSEFLYILDLFLQDIFKNKDYNCEKCYKSIICLFTSLDLDYTWNEEKGRIERKIDKANTVVINNNLEKLDFDTDYQDCVDEFLKPRADIDFLKSLKHIYSVLEKVAGKHEDKSGKLRLHEKQRLAKYIIRKEKHYEAIQHVFGFINDFIHHSKPDHQFNKNEYIYWWLEINKLIFILNSDYD